MMQYIYYPEFSQMIIDEIKCVYKYHVNELNDVLLLSICLCIYLLMKQICLLFRDVESGDYLNNIETYITNNIIELMGIPSSELNQFKQILMNHLNK